jgi:FMN phosphatase YigB (HAD superfamily)
MVKCVVFDFMGVVFSEGHIIRNALYPMLRSRGFTYDYVKRTYLEYTDGSLRNEDFWRKFFIKGDYRDFERKFLDSLPLDGDFNNVSRELKERRLRLAALSHLPIEWGSYLVKRYAFNNIFDEIVITGEFKAKKTDRQIYEVLLRKLGMNASDCLFVDNELSYLQIASSLGFKTMLMKREEVTGEFRPDFVISSLKDIVRIVNGDL